MLCIDHRALRCSVASFFPSNIQSSACIVPLSFILFPVQRLTLFRSYSFACLCAVVQKNCSSLVGYVVKGSKGCRGSNKRCLSTIHLRPARVISAYTQLHKDHSMAPHFELGGIGNWQSMCMHYRARQDSETHAAFALFFGGLSLAGVVPHCRIRTIF